MESAGPCVFIGTKCYFCLEETILYKNEHTQKRELAICGVSTHTIKLNNGDPNFVSR